MNDKSLSQEPICDRDCEHCTWTECPIEPCDDVEQIDYHDDFETASRKIHDYEERYRKIKAEGRGEDKE